MLSRYMAICHPLSPHARSSPGQAKKTILKIWLVSFVTAAPWSQYTQVHCSPLSLVELTRLGSHWSYFATSNLMP